jgi:dimethylargininase
MRRGRFDEAVFDGFEKLIVPEEEGYAANCLAANGMVLVSAGYPETKRLIEAADFPTIPIEMSEFRKGEGALTCLSILF